MVKFKNHGLDCRRVVCVCNKLQGLEPNRVILGESNRDVKKWSEFEKSRMSMINSALRSLRARKWLSQNFGAYQTKLLLLFIHTVCTLIRV